MLTVGSLFSGIGGFDLGLERAGFEIKWQVEIDDYCRKVLRKHWPAVPCHYDIRTIDWHFIPRVDLVCGGFPCQPFSLAGKRRGAEDDRYLWPEVVRCLSTIRPAWFLGENVPGLLHLGIEQVLSDLEALGYQTAVLGIPACGVDAPHIRQRLWFLGHAAQLHQYGGRTERVTSQPQVSESGNASSQNDVADTECSKRRPISEACADYRPDGYAQREEGAVRSGVGGAVMADANSTGPHAGAYRGVHSGEKGRRARNVESQRFSRWLPEPAVGRVAHGVPSRVDRLKGLGNAIVPQIAEALGRMIIEAHQR